MPKDSPRSQRPWLAKSAFPRSTGSLLPWLLAAMSGLAAGIGAYTFSYAKGFSYFGTDPRACVNCHIMEPEYAGWQKSSHHDVARCIDCHLPASFIPKYLVKAENGYRHGKLFTTQTFEEPITVKPAGLAVLQANCQRCHTDLVHDLVTHPGRGEEAEEVSCVHCHWAVGHGERAGLGGPRGGAELLESELLESPE
jgi:cytochrome c nitrite reductase small subunit